MPDLSIEEIVGDMGHLVQERVDPDGVVRGKHQVHMKRDLDHGSAALGCTGDHLAQPRREAIGEPDRHGRRQPAQEPCGVQVTVQTLKVDTLERSRTAGSGAARRTH